MSSPRFSVVIPTRDRPNTLRVALRTCLAQEFDDCEFLVSDNGSAPATREVVESCTDRRVRYVKTPRPLAMSDSWDYALTQAAGEYLLVIGDDDGLLLHALPEIDRLIRLLDLRLLRWESVCYNWPDLPDQPHASPHELLIPLGQVDYYYTIQRREARHMMQAAANGETSYAQLPSLYCSAVHRTLLADLRARTGRLFRSQCPDVYSGFALARLVGTYYSVAASMTISGLSGRSNGVAGLYLKGRSPIADDFQRLNAEAGYTLYPGIPDLPVMPVLVADSFQHARATLFRDDTTVRLDRQKLIVNCMVAVSVADETEWGEVLARVRHALADDVRLAAWFETAYGASRPDRFPRVPSRPVLNRYGGTYLHLDAAEFGVSDVWGVAQLCERLLGGRRDGINAHVAPERPAIPASQATEVPASLGSPEAPGPRVRPDFSGAAPP